MVLPFVSTIVVTAGTSPSSSCAEPLATTSEARLDASPIPPTSGNSSAATTTLANAQHPASLATATTVAGGAGMGITLAAPATMQAAKWPEEERRYRFGQRRCR